MKKILFVGLLICAVGFWGCKDDESETNLSIADYIASNNITGLTETSSGLLYKIEDEGSGELLVFGDSLEILLTGKFTDDVEFASFQNSESPLSFVFVEDELIKGLEEGLSLLKQGMKITFYIPSELAYGTTGNRGDIGADTDLIYTINMIDLIPRWTIANYLIENDITNYQETVSGLIYVIDEPGEGELPQEGQSAEVHYTGYHLTDIKFDSSYDRDKTFTFVIGAGKVISGWEEGISLFKSGGKGTLYIPYEMAYGKGGKLNLIAPYEDLKFDINLISVK